MSFKTSLSKGTIEADIDTYNKIEETLNKKQFEIDNLQHQIAKAIDYINKNLYLPMDLDKKNELLSILQGEEVK